MAKVKKTPENVTHSELMAAMAEARRAALGDILPTRPPGVFTAMEYATQHGMSRPGASSQLEMLVRRGTLKREHAIIKNVDGRPRRTIVYSVVKTK